MIFKDFKYSRLFTCYAKYKKKTEMHNASLEDSRVTALLTNKNRN